MPSSLLPRAAGPRPPRRGLRALSLQAGSPGLGPPENSCRGGQEQRRTPKMRAGGRVWSWLRSCMSPSPHAGQQEPDKDPVAFRVSPSSGLLEARPVNAPPTSVPLQVSFTARYGPPSLAGAASGALAQGPQLISAPAPHRSCELYESTLVVEGVLGEKSGTLRLRGRGSYDERYASPY